MKIGVFDSGIGGLWILKHLKERLPLYDYVFVGDQKNVPYGPKKIEEIRNFSENITNFLIKEGCNLIVIACNTASAAALKYLREKFPNIIFVGMEPAVKPAVLNTHTKKVGVLATPATFQGELYNSVVERFAQGVEIFKDTCPGLVEQIEKREFSSQKTKSILEKAILPMVESGIDTIVLGCTHYPYVIPLIKEIVGENVLVIDPTQSIVKRVEELSDKVPLSGKMEVYTTGDDPINLEKFLEKGQKVDKIIL